MAALQCEICGGKLIGKPGGMFECDSCGVEYSTEWCRAKVQEIKGTVKIEGPVEVTGAVKVEGGASVESLLSRGSLALEDEDWAKAKELFDQVLSIDPENAEAYLGMHMADWRYRTREAYADAYVRSLDLGDSKPMLRAKQFAGEELKSWLEGLEPKRQKAEKQREIEAEAEYQRWEAERQPYILTVAAKRRELAAAEGLIGAKYSRLVGLKKDGTVVDGYGYLQRDIDNWRYIVAVTNGYFHIVGLKKDGTVVASGNNEWNECNVSDWRDIIAIAAGNGYTVGLRKDGTVVVTSGHNDVSDWQGIVSVASGGSHIVGLRADGTVLASGNNNWNECNVSDWRDIIAVAAGDAYTVGLRKDGTVVAVGHIGENWCNISGWQDIVAVAAGDKHTVGLKVDGTVVAVGDNEYSQCDVSDWQDIVAVAAGENFTVGLRKDGTVAIKGNNKHCLENWKLFDSLETLEQEREKAFEERRLKDVKIEADAKYQEEVARQKEEARQAKIAALKAEKASIRAELPTIKGLFSGGKRRELEARLTEIEEELKKL